MAATARQIPVSKEDLDNDGGGLYASIQCPGDYEAVLLAVDDYDRRDSGKSFGWIFSYGVTSPTGAQVPFNDFVSFSEKSRWRLLKVLDAFGVDISEGLNSVDPNLLVGDVVGVHIDWDENKKYRNIEDVYSLTDEVPVPTHDVPASVADTLQARQELGLPYDPAVDGAPFGAEAPVI